MELDLSKSISEIMQRGFGVIDMTPHHGPPKKQRPLFDSIALVSSWVGLSIEDPPIVPFIRRNGLLMDIVRCDRCGAPFSFPIDEMRVDGSTPGGVLAALLLGSGIRAQEVHCGACAEWA